MIKYLLLQFRKMQGLVEVKNFRSVRVENVAVLIITGDMRMVAFTGKNGTVGLPAGIIDKTDGGVFAAAKREYLEESGVEMPILSDMRFFVWNGHTGIIVGFTDDDIKTGPPTNGDGEVSDVRLTRISDMIEAAKGRRSFMVRKCARNSFLALCKALGF